MPPIKTDGKPVTLPKLPDAQKTIAPATTVVTSTVGPVVTTTTKPVADVYGANGTAAASPSPSTKFAKPIANPPDFVDIGLGPTGMMEMLETIIKGRTAVGVELRGDPILGVHQNIRVDWFHMLGKIDKEMEARYGADRIPTFPPTGKPFKLEEVFFRPEMLSGPMDWPEIIRGDGPQNIGGRIHGVYFEDARDATVKANGGKPRVISVTPPAAPDHADPSKVRTDMKEVLDGPSTFQAAIFNYTGMMRAYLELMEKQDVERGLPPRARILTNTRVVQDDGGKTTGFIPQPGFQPGKPGHMRIIVEQLSDQNVPGERPKRVRTPGTEAIDLGVPKLWSLNPGAGGAVGPEAEALGYKQHDVVYKDSVSGESVTAQQNWIVGEVSANVGGQLIRRVSTLTDPETGESQTVRQITVGHENADRIAWTLVQIPDFMSFDPVKRGVLPEGTSPKSPEFAKAAQNLVYDFYLQEAGAVLHIPPEQIKEMRMVFGPNMFTLTERIGDSAQVAANGVVSGDLMGNGSFLTSGGAMTGMVGHAQRIGQFWEDLDKGVSQDDAMTKLATAIKGDTEAWLHVSAKEFSDVVPVNFGEERAKQLHLSSDPVEGAKKPRLADLGLQSVLGAGNWAQAIAKLQKGDFGKPKTDYYVPEKEVDVLNDTHLPTQSPFWVRTGEVPRAQHRS